MRLLVDQDGCAPVLDQVISLLDADDRYPARNFRQVIFNGGRPLQDSSPEQGAVAPTSLKRRKKP
jgi:hypothetical protein